MSHIQSPIWNKCHILGVWLYQNYIAIVFYFNLIADSSFVSAIMKWGLCFVSRYVLDMYCPIIPRHKSWIPPIKITTQMIEAQPATGSPNISRRIMMTASAKNEKNVIVVPNQDAMLKGTCEKLMIPSIAYLNNFQKFHFVSPATLSTFSYGIQ